MPYVGFSLFFKGGRRNFPVFFSSLQRRAKIEKNTKRCSRFAPFTNQQQKNEKKFSGAGAPSGSSASRFRSQARRAFEKDNSKPGYDFTPRAAPVPHTCIMFIVHLVVLPVLECIKVVRVDHLCRHRLVHPSLLRPQETIRRLRREVCLVTTVHVNLDFWYGASSVP